MRFGLFTACSTLVLSLVAADVVSAADVPAEFPPSSFKGRQYVDSTGCVFIRAGVGTAVTWIPRVNRQRRQVCGQVPSLQNAQIARAPQPRAVEQLTVEAQPAPQAEAKKPIVQRASKPAPKPKAAPKRVAESKPAQPKPRVAQAAPSAGPKPTLLQRLLNVKPTERQEAAVQPSPRQVQRPVQAPTPKVVAQPKIEQQPRASKSVAAVRTPACNGGNSVSAKYINSGEGVRCGPQAVSPFGTGIVAQAAPSAVQVPQAQPKAKAVQPRRVEQVATARPVILSPEPAPRRVAAAPAPVNPNQRVAPRHVVENRQNTIITEVPKGYQPVWNDDRLNPHRAEQTLSGNSDMKLLWTTSLPRRLINQATGEDLTAKLALIFPYTDRKTQEREYGKVTLERRDGVVVKKVRRNRLVAKKRVVTTKAAPAPRVSTRSVANPARRAQAAPKVRAASKVQAAAGSRSIQVGVFGVADNATRTAQRLQRAGIPVRIGTVTRGGKSYRSVVAGPFGAVEAISALQRIRSAGFGDAYLR